MDNDIITQALALFSTLAAGGLTALGVRSRKLLAPLLGRRGLRVCIVCAPEFTEACTAFRQQIKAAGYQHVTLTHSPAAASADALLLWKPNNTTAAQVVRELRLAAPLAYLLLFTQERLDVTIDDRTLLANSKLRLLSDLGTVAEAHAAEGDR